VNIAVTGASGFIGSELLSELASREGITIAALSRTARKNTDVTEWYATDYSRESLIGILADCDVVIHLAGVRGTTDNPGDYADNERITANLLDAMTEVGYRRIVFASTISVYNDVETIPWTEDSPLEPRTMYGASKIACEEMIRKYAERGIDYSILRIAQVLGAGEKRRGMMNVFLDTAAAGGEIKVMGRSEAKRQYIYVKDLVKVMASLAGLPEGESVTVNVGMPDAYTNLEIAEIINKVYGNRTPVNYDDSVPETIKSSCMDISFLRDVIGYTPMTMEEAVSAYASL